MTTRRIKHRAEVLAESLANARRADELKAPNATQCWEAVADAYVLLREATLPDEPIEGVNCPWWEDVRDYGAGKTA